MIRVAVELDLSLPDHVDTTELLASFRRVVSDSGGGTLSAWAGPGPTEGDAA